MPRTADRRAQARRVARVRRAHVEPPRPAAARRLPAAKRQQPKGLAAIVRDYPWATTIFVVLVVAAIGLVLHQQRAWMFAPPPAKAKVTATAVAKTGCDLTTHTCAAPKMTIDPNKTYTATIHTAKGDIVITLDAKNDPITVNNFVYLSDQKFYDGTYFWRVETPGKPSVIDPSGQPSTLSLIQGGSVAKDGSDAVTIPGYTIQDEKVTEGYTPGTIAMANTGKPNTGSSQFFIDTGDNTPYFSKTYTIFGHVTSGLDVAKQIQPADKINSISIAVK